jgi:Transcriptional regulator PadR-like family
MAENSGELVQGTLEMLVLKTLALEPMHGYGLAQRIEQISDHVFRVNPGSWFSTTLGFRKGTTVIFRGGGKRIIGGRCATSFTDRRIA